MSDDEAIDFDALHFLDTRATRLQQDHIDHIKHYPRYTKEILHDHGETVEVDMSARCGK